MDAFTALKVHRWYRIDGQVILPVRFTAHCRPEIIDLEGVRQEDAAAYDAYCHLVEHQGNYYTRAEVEGIPFPELISMKIAFDTQIEEVAGVVESTATVVEDRNALPAPGGK